MASAEWAAGGTASGTDRLIVGVAILGGVVGWISTASIAAFFAVGGPFGAINDWMTGLLGALCGVLAIAPRRRGGTTPSLPDRVTVALAAVGSVVAVVGSALVISNRTGYLLAGLVESLGFALIGVWLIAVNRSLSPTTWCPPRLAGLGIAAGAVLTIGFLLVPGIAMGLDDASTAPVWVWIGFLGWLGIFFLLPAWCIWFGVALRRESDRRAIDQ